MSIRRSFKTFLWNHLVSGIQDGLATQRLRSLISDGPYIPWSDSALSATAVSTVLNDIVINDRSTIVECGGGVSTLFIGSLLKQQGETRKQLYTIEHDEEWMEILESMVDDHGISEWVTILYAPLRETSLSWNGEEWYSTTAIGSSLDQVVVDLLLIDGPPAYRAGASHSRYPAVPFFKEMMCDKCCIVLDDINRPAEREIAQDWERELGISFQERLLKGNISVGVRGEAFTV